jgi:hypothetical protein
MVCFADNVNSWMLFFEKNSFLGTSLFFHPVKRGGCARPGGVHPPIIRMARHLLPRNRARTQTAMSMT